MLIYDIMDYTEEENIPDLLLLIDFEKAFDTLSWNFIQQTLNLFKFGPFIKNALNSFIRILHSWLTRVATCLKLFIFREDAEKDTLFLHISF